MSISQMSPGALSKWAMIAGVIIFFIALLIVFDVIDIELTGFGLPNDQEVVIGIILACGSVGAFILGLWVRYKFKSNSPSGSASLGMGH